MLQQSLALISLRAFNVQEYNMSTNVLCLSKTFEETFLPLLPLKIIPRNLLIMWFSNIFLCDQNPSAWSHMRNFELRSKQNTSCCCNSRMFPAMCVTVWLTVPGLTHLQTFFPISQLRARQLLIYLSDWVISEKCKSLMQKPWCRWVSVVTLSCESKGLTLTSQQSFYFQFSVVFIMLHKLIRILYIFKNVIV